MELGQQKKNCWQSSLWNFFQFPVLMAASFLNTKRVQIGLFHSLHSIFCERKVVLILYLAKVLSFLLSFERNVFLVLQRQICSKIIQKRRQKLEIFHIACLFCLNQSSKNKIWSNKISYLKQFSATIGCRLFLLITETKIDLNLTRKWSVSQLGNDSPHGVIFCQGQ